jgi:hypothetical protein
MKLMITDADLPAIRLRRQALAGGYCGFFR